MKGILRVDDRLERGVRLKAGALVDLSHYTSGQREELVRRGVYVLQPAPAPANNKEQPDHDEVHGQERDD